MLTTTPGNRLILPGFGTNGDRRYGDDPAMVVGFARIGSIKVLVVGEQRAVAVEDLSELGLVVLHAPGRGAVAAVQAHS